MSLSLLHAPPPTLEPAAGRSAGTTPSTFEGVPPVLRWHAPRAEVRLSSLPPALAGATFTPQGRAVQAEGQVWVTDSALSFLPDSGVGFSVAHGGITLHALTRSLPAQLKRKSDTALYLHLDDSPEQDDDEDGGSLTEMWIILPEQGGSLQEAFDAVSYAATLVPASGDAGADNPLAAFGPFGTGCMAGPCGIVLDDPLPEEQDRPGKSDTSYRAPVADSDSSSSVLIFSGLPSEFFLHPHLARALLDLLNAYGLLRQYVPLAPHRRAIVVYEEAGPAAKAKRKLDHLPLPSSRGDEQIRVYFGQKGDELIWAPREEDSHLHVPAPEKNFLISPPGSPPVGWEASREGAPAKDVLANDLVAALTKLTKPSTNEAEAVPSSAQQDATPPQGPDARLGSHGGPLVVLPPDGGMPGVSLDLVEEESPEEGPTIAQVQAAYAAHATPAPPVPPASGSDEMGASVRIQPTARPPVETMDI